MRLLLDSNVLLLSIFDTKRLTQRTLELLSDSRNDFFVSGASIWELAIKVAKGRLDMPGSSIQYLLDQIEKAGLTVVPIEDSHILRTETLPQHHAHPFDRILVAQAIEEDLTILTSDQEIPSYDVKVIWK